MSDSPIVVARVATERGELVLRQVGNDYEVISNGTFLMDTRDGHSERLLVDAALQRHHAPHDVLIGGLGVGFSLVAALADHRVAQVTVVEVEQALVDWHDTHLASFSGGLLHDARVVVVVADISTHLAARASSYDVVCLDVDNGPDWTVIDETPRCTTTPARVSSSERCDHRACCRCGARMRRRPTSSGCGPTSTT